MGKTFKSGYLQNLIAYDVNGNITLPGTLTISGNALVATQSYVSTQLASLVGSAPGALDTLNELATALGNDAAFATSVTNSIASKLSLSGGTLTGALNGTSAQFTSQVNIFNSSALRLARFGTESSYYGDVAYTVGGLVLTSVEGYIKIGKGAASSPTTYLSIIDGGAATFSSNLTIQGNDLDLNNGTVLHRITNDNTNLLIRADYGNSSSNSTIQFSIDGADKMIITSSGNVGIGITNPQSQLHINGDLTFSESGYNTVRLHQIAHSHSNGSAINNFIRFLVSDGNGNGNTIERMRINGNGGVGINTTTFVDPVFKLQVGDGSADTRALFNSNNAYAISIRNGASSLWYLGVNAQTQTNGFQIFSNQGGAAMTLTTENNVGIGTTSPTNGKLEIQQTATTAALWVQTGGTSGSYTIADFRTGSNLSAFSIKGNGDLYVANNAALFFGSSALTYLAGGNSALSMAVNGSERIRISSVGILGVGVSSPSNWDSTLKAIEVGQYGNFYAGFNGGYAIYMGSNAYYNAGWKYSTTGGNAPILVDMGAGSFSVRNAPTGTANDALTFTTRFVVNYDGNVGIGTSDFSNLGFAYPLLKIAGSRATLGLQSSGSLSTIALISANNISTAMHLNYENTGAFRWYNYSSATETFTLLGNGRLGLGVSSPDARLHVGGAILVSNSSQTYRRAITCYGQSGTFTQVKVKFNKTNWGSVTYDIKLGSAGGSYHTAGAYYSNPGFSSHVNSINAGNGPTMSLVAEDSNGGTQGATWTFYGATMIHPIVTVDIACGNGYQVNPDDITVQFT